MHGSVTHGPHQHMQIARMRALELAPADPLDQQWYYLILRPYR